MIKIVAHRGASKRAHENTIKSFRAALALGADMVELDVRKSGDGTLVVFHDPYLSRKTRRPAIAGLTYAEINKRAAKIKFRVPKLKEAFEALAGKTMLDIELKEGGYEQEVLSLAKEHFPLDKFILTSFNPEIVAAIKAADAKATTGLILAAAENLPHCEKTRADVLAPQIALFDSQRAFFADKKKQGKKIAVWTVDNTNDLSRLLIDPIVDAIITNRPDRAVELRKRLCNG
jgi:glycerophosphoryl diester phosphodiesterase